MEINDTQSGEKEETIEEIIAEKDPGLLLELKRDRWRSSAIGTPIWPFVVLIVVGLIADLLFSDPSCPYFFARPRPLPPWLAIGGGILFVKYGVQKIRRDDPTAAYGLLGILLGVFLIIGGVTTLYIGRTALLCILFF